MRGRLCRDQTCAKKEHDTVVSDDGRRSLSSLSLVLWTVCTFSDSVHLYTQHGLIRSSRRPSAQRVQRARQHEARRRGSRRPVDNRLRDVKPRYRSPRGAQMPDRVRSRCRWHARSRAGAPRGSCLVTSRRPSAPGFGFGRYRVSRRVRKLTQEPKRNAVADL